jgi:voltage-gated potassium channel Kch
MIGPMDAVLFIVGAFVFGIVLWDIFQSIVVPRPTPGGLRLARYVIPPTWRLWRALGTRRRDANAADWFLGLFAPGAAILLFAGWLVVLIAADGLMLFALRAQITPHLGDYGDAVYFAGTSVLTLGFGEIVASGFLPRIIVLVSAATGLGVVALVITFIFSLFASYQRREVLVVTLTARAKAPPSATTLLETYARLEMVDKLPALFHDWETWSAEVLDSHVAYPLLGYFRSSHDSISWISALGAVLDAAGLVVTTIKGVPRGQPELTLRVGAHLVEDIANYIRQPDDGAAVAREDFAAAYERLAKVGYELEPQDRAWRAFERVRRTYAGRLDALASYWATPAPSWSVHKVHDESAVHAPAPTASA